MSDVPPADDAAAPVDAPVEDVVDAPVDAPDAAPVDAPVETVDDAAPVAADDPQEAPQADDVPADAAPVVVPDGGAPDQPIVTSVEQTDDAPENVAVPLPDQAVADVLEVEVVSDDPREEVDPLAAPQDAAIVYDADGRPVGFVPQGGGLILRPGDSVEIRAE